MMSTEYDALFSSEYGDDDSVRQVARMPESLLDNWAVGGDDNLLDAVPQHILEKVNGDIEAYRGYDVTNGGPRCDRASDGRLLLPVIPVRCSMHWNLGREIARGSHAIVFSTTNTNSKEYVARVVQLSDDTDRVAGFRRDVETRLAIGCLVPKDMPSTIDMMAIGVDYLRDAFICMQPDNTDNLYGFTVSERYSGTALSHFITIKDPVDREVFMVRFQRALDTLLSVLHTAGFAHLDVHHGNLLYHERKDKIVLTDFESTIGARFDTPDRLLSAYINAENTESVMNEMGCVNEYLLTGGNRNNYPDLWEDLLDYGITKDVLSGPFLGVDKNLNPGYEVTSD